jgi:hypothetical protein
MSSERSPKGKLGMVIGSVLALAGLVFVVLAASAGEDALTLLAALVFVAGVLRLTTGLSAYARHSRELATDPDDPRWDETSRWIQVAGRPCVECGRRITFSAEGYACELCESHAHRDCREAHERHARQLVAEEEVAGEA